MFSSLISALGNQSPVALLDQPVIYSGLVWFEGWNQTKPNQQAHWSGPPSGLLNLIAGVYDGT